MTQTTKQTLHFESLHLEAIDPRPVPYFLSGRKLYAIGTTSGALEPVGSEHLAGEMGGVWAHPVKFLDGWHLAVHDQHGSRNVLPCIAFEGHLSDITMRFEHGSLACTRTDFVVHDEAAIFSLVEIYNQGSLPWSGTWGLVAQINILPAWFSGWETGGVEIVQEGGNVVAWDKAWRGRWGMALGSQPLPDDVVFNQHDGKPTAELRYKLTLQPGERLNVDFLATCDHQNGHSGAIHLFDNLMGRSAELLHEKREHYRQIACEGVTLRTPDERVNTDWMLAKANLLMLEADYSPYLHEFLLAGIPEYPQLFSCDNTYTAPGAVGAGFHEVVRSTLLLLGDYARRSCGRVPHEVTTNGRTFNPGNTQETPQFAIAVWDYFRWTGDIDFLRLMYPVCREGVMEYMPSFWDGDRDGYPSGDAMVERHGMGSLKLDSACYLYGAWQALAQMARVLGRSEADEYEHLAADWLARFERDWWLDGVGLYADSLHSDYRPQLDGHWTQVVPVQMGIALPERGQRVLENIARDFTNRWGLVHTRNQDERVWTLPTGLLVLAELRYGRAERALQYLHNISETARSGMLGAFKELIPEGLCFVQLWSVGLYIQGLIEGLMGLDPLAHEHRLRIAPVLPSTWPAMTIQKLQIGTHLLNLTVGQTHCEIEHVTGSHALEVVFEARGTTIAALQIVVIGPHSAADRVKLRGSSVHFVVEGEQRAKVLINEQQVCVQYTALQAAAGDSNI